MHGCVVIQAQLLDQPLHSARSTADWVRRTLGEDGLLGCWDLSQKLSTVRMIDVGPHSLSGELFNTPTRGVKGPSWSGEYQSWEVSAAAGHAGEYDAVHFHEDDLTDCAWRTSLVLPLPDNLRSGVYALKLLQGGLEYGEQWIDYIPVHTPFNIELVYDLNTFSMIIKCPNEHTRHDGRNAMQNSTGVYTNIEWSRYS